MFSAFLDLTLLPMMPRTIPLPGEAVAKAISQIMLWLEPLALVVAGILTAAALVWCFLGYRLRRVRHAFGMALLGAAVALVAALLIEPGLTAMTALIIGAAAAVIFGAVGAIFWRIGAAVSYFVTAFALVFVGLGLLFPTLEIVWGAVIAGLVGIGAMLLLIFVMPDAEIVLSSLAGLLAAGAGARLLSGLFPAWFDSSDETIVRWTVLGVGAALTVGGMIVQYLTTRKLRPLRRSQNKQLADAKEAIRAAAAITFDEGIVPAAKDDAAEKSEDAADKTAAEPTEAADQAEDQPEPETTPNEPELPLPELPEIEPERVEIEPERVEPAQETAAPAQAAEPVQETAETPETAPETAPETVEAAPETPAASPVILPPDSDVPCPACGGLNEPGSRFCSWCGIKL